MWPKGVKRGRGLRPITEDQENIGEAATSEKQTDTETTGKRAKVTAKAAPPSFLPYLGKDGLPKYEKIGTRKPKIIKGPPQYELIRLPGRKVKLVAYFRKPSGVTRRGLRVLNLTPKHPEDQLLYQRMKKAGIPEV